MSSYIIASSKDWFLRTAKLETFGRLNIKYISKKEELTNEFLEKVNPKYIFFPHWSWKIDKSIYEKYECIVFHTAPLPYGRGGSPIQNLIINGYKSAPVNAIRVTDIIDGGPIYKSINVSLDGNISDIFSRIAVCIENLILLICYESPRPVEQSGNVFNFSRLSVKDNEIDSHYSLEQIYDRIRMVDGEGYPKAFIRFGKYYIKLSKAELSERWLSAEIRISEFAD